MHGATFEFHVSVTGWPMTCPVVSAVRVTLGVGTMSTLALAFAVQAPEPQVTVKTCVPSFCSSRLIDSLVSIGPAVPAQPSPEAPPDRVHGRTLVLKAISKGVPIGTCVGAANSIEGVPVQSTVVDAWAVSAPVPQVRV